MRLFAALPITEEAEERISKEMKAVRQQLRGKNIRYKPPQKWHFTLVFLGNQNKNDLESIKAGLGKVSSQIEPTEIKMDKITYFPPNSEPSMLWARTTKETSKKMGAIQQKITKALQQEGVSWDKDNRTYKGHVTLARFKYHEVEPLPEIEQQINLSFTPKSIVLMESELKRSGSEYEILEEFSIE